MGLPSLPSVTESGTGLGMGARLMGLLEDPPRSVGENGVEEGTWCGTGDGGQGRNSENPAISLNSKLSKCMC